MWIKDPDPDPDPGDPKRPDPDPQHCFKQNIGIMKSNGCRFTSKLNHSLIKRVREKTEIKAKYFSSMIDKYIKQFHYNFQYIKTKDIYVQNFVPYYLCCSN